MAGEGTDLTDAAKAAAATISKHELLDSSQLVLVAFSGGADSTALCLILRHLGHRVVLGHIDHAMHPNSAVDAEHCRAAASAWGVPIHVTRLAKPPSTEAMARRDRYEALQAIVVEAGADRIATGHTLDDQAETVKMRLDRGGFGLGIPYRRGCIVRPLLDVRRRATESVCAEQSAPYLTDPTNADLRYTRNRVRLELKQAGDETILDLARLADVSRAEVDAMTRVALDLSTEAVAFEDGLVFIDRSIAEYSANQASAVLRIVFQRLEIEAGHRLIEDLLTKILPVTGSRLDLPGGLVAWTEPDHLVIGEAIPVEDLPEMELRNPGMTRCREWGLDINIQHRATSTLSHDPWEEFFDEARLKGPLAIRQWRPGDSFQPLGMHGSKKLQDYFVDAKVPRRLRDGIPILVCDDQIAWVVGQRIDDRFKITDDSRGAVQVRVTRTVESKP